MLRGYPYFHCIDCWLSTRTPQTDLQPRLPRGSSSLHPFPLLTLDLFSALVDVPQPHFWTSFQSLFSQCSLQHLLQLDKLGFFQLIHSYNDSLCHVSPHHHLSVTNKKKVPGCSVTPLQLRVLFALPEDPGFDSWQPCHVASNYQ